MRHAAPELSRPRSRLTSALLQRTLETSALRIQLLEDSPRSTPSTLAR